MHLVYLFFFAIFINYIIIIISEKTAFCVDKNHIIKPQKFHSTPTSRAGGLGIFVVSLVGLSYLGINGLLLFLSGLPVFLIGFYEDVNSNVSPKIRLFIMAFSGVIAIFMYDCIIYDLGIFNLPVWIAIPFTIFAITGASNAINIIDGFHGLAAGVSIIILLSLLATAHMVGDHMIVGISSVLISVLAGFLIWNFPKGKIFLGDGGAYFIGFLIALLSILLVKRNQWISPWFPMLVLSYPILEVFFSIYRKSFKRNGSAFHPDRVHLHMLIYQRLTKSHAKTSVQIWVIVFIVNILAFTFHSNTLALFFVFILFSVFYIYLYRKIVRFKNNSFSMWQWKIFSNKFNQTVKSNNGIED